MNNRLMIQWTDWGEVLSVYINKTLLSFSITIDFQRPYNSAFTHQFLPAIVHQRDQLLHTVLRHIL